MFIIFHLIRVYLISIVNPDVAACINDISVSLISLQSCLGLALATLAVSWIKTSTKWLGTRSRLFSEVSWDLMRLHLIMRSSEGVSARSREEVRRKSIFIHFGVTHRLPEVFHTATHFPSDEEGRDAIGSGCFNLWSGYIILLFICGHFGSCLICNIARWHRLLGQTCNAHRALLHIYPILPLIFLKERRIEFCYTIFEIRGSLC